MSIPQCRTIFFVVLVLAGLAFPAHGHGASTEYEVEIPDLPDGLTALLASVSDCVGLKDNPPTAPACCANAWQAMWKLLPIL